MSTMNIFDLTDTWNAGGTTFTAIKMNATDTASAATSMLIDLQVGGTTQFHVLKSGAVHTKRSNYNITSANTEIITVSNYSLTGSAANSLVDLSGTWNTSGTPTALKLNVTDTASNAASLLIDLQVGGVSRFSVTKAGFLTALGSGGIFQRDSDATEGPNLTLYQNTASPASNDIMGFLEFRSRDGAGNEQTYGDMQCRIVDATSGSEDGRLIFRTAVAGAYAPRIEIAGGLYTSGATGGDQGINTINAGAVYDDGVLLTCYVLEAWLTGGIDVDFWDGLVLDRQIPALVVEQGLGNFVEVEPARIEERRHERARGFANVAADRLDIDKFAQFLRTNKRLPAFPGPEQWQALYSGKMSTGDLLQRIWETCEVLAVHIVEARERELALEARITALENA